MRILVTWWTWFIGSHTVIELIQAGHEVVIFDNLTNSEKWVISQIASLTETSPELVVWDLRSLDELKRVFEQHDFEAVIHFAWLKSVGVSCQDPFTYYDANIVGTMNLLALMDTYDVRKLIFSSSATVYDSVVETSPFDETMSTGNTTNPYGTTKFVIEQLLKDMANWKQMSCISLRYFNPIGAHPSGVIGEDPTDVPTNLLPVIMDVAEGKREVLHIYGNNYDTPDGTCIRDYIHVVDLAQAHMVALGALESPWHQIYNVWTWAGTSVLQMHELVQQCADTTVPYEIVGRRDGDVPVAVAKVDKMQSQLWRSAKLSVEQAVKDALRFRENKKADKLISKWVNK